MNQSERIISHVDNVIKIISKPYLKDNVMIANDYIKAIASLNAIRETQLKGVKDAN